MDDNGAFGSPRGAEQSMSTKNLLVIFSVVIAVLLASPKWKLSIRHLLPINTATKQSNIASTPPVVPFVLIRRDGDIAPHRLIQKSLEKYNTDTYQALKGLSKQMDQAIELEHGLAIDQAAKLSTKIQRRIQRLSTIFEHNEQVVSSLLGSPAFTMSLPDSRIINDGTQKREVMERQSSNPPSNVNLSTHFNMPKGNTTKKHPEENVYDMAAQIVAHLVRDWTIAGSSIRASLYGWVCQQLQQHHGTSKKDPVLVPGAGMGRLAYDLYSHGFTVEANEISPVMATAAKSILTKSDISAVVYPFALDAMTNEVDSLRRYDNVSFPDVTVVQNLQTSLSFTIGDFVGPYYSHQRSTFGAVATCFFIDTATDIYEYIALIKCLLKPRGTWVNVGPIQWHANALLRPSADELRDLIAAFGFHIVTWSIDQKPVPYRQDTTSNSGKGSSPFVRSTSFEGYRPLRFVAMKRS